MKSMILFSILMSSLLSASGFARGLTFGQDGTTMHVYSDNQRIVTWYDYKDHAVRGSYFLMSDTGGETWAYDYQGNVLTKWYDSASYPWILQEDYFILIDTAGAAWAYDLSGTVLSKWNHFSGAYAFRNYYVMLDSLGETWVYRPDGTVITKWYDSKDGQYRWDFFALSDTDGKTWVYKLDGTILTKWNDTKSYELGDHFYALLDTFGELAIYDLEGNKIQEVQGVTELEPARRGGIRYLKNGNWYEFS